MASSRIEIPSSSPFGCVLRDHNQRESFMSKNAKSGFRKNITELGDHFFPCINVDESTTPAMGLSPRHTRFLDRWATRQAQETASTIEKKTHEAEIQALSNSQAVSSKMTSVFLRETSPALSDTSVVEVDLLLPNVVGASSLVQMWEARLNRSNTLNLNSTNSPNSTVTVVSGDSRTNSGLSNDDTNNHVLSSQMDDDEEPSSRGFENGGFSEEKWENENESDQRIKVSDIVRKLTSDETNQNHHRANNNTTSEQKSNVVRLPRIKARFAAFDQHVDQGNFLQVGKSPRIRGRQAFNDLLMQMERDRHRELDGLVERHAVSRFQQRGLLQAMMRLRFLQRGVAIQEQRRPVPKNPLPRDRFNIKVEHGDCTVRAEESGSSTLRLDMTIISSASSHISENNIHHHDQHRVDSSRSSVTCAFEVFHENSSSTSDITWQEEGDNFEVNTNNLDTQETDPDQNIWDENETVDEQEADDGDYDDNQQIMGNNYDWFRDICRPRVHWEGRRQAWYHEMLESDSNNGEIKQLLARKTVSTCLASDFRHRIDQLMALRLNQQTRTSHREEEEDSENEERMGQLMMSFLQKHTHQAGAQEHDEREDNVEEDDDEAEYEEQEEEEEESSIGHHQYQEAGDYFSQTPSSVQLPNLPSPISSAWSGSYRDQVNGGNDDSDQAAPTPLSFAQSPPSQSYYHQEPRVDTSSLNHGRGPSLEMELIYDLRGQMEQLHREMSELNNTIKSCMDMQLQLQHSFKPEDHSVQVERGEEKSINREPKKGNCCICYKMKVDSLLYRCGHMCTCLKCAHELQCSSGKCPICRAPIVDAVRAFPQS